MGRLLTNQSLVNYYTTKTLNEAIKNTTRDHDQPTGYKPPITTISTSTNGIKPRGNPLN